jgi:hypothetical protein
MRHRSSAWRASWGALLVMAAACDRSIVLGDAENAICIAPTCGGALADAGRGGQAGTAAGSSPISGGGSGGGSGGQTMVGEGGSDAGQAGAGPSAPSCVPSADDRVCDGLDEACQSTADDAGCADTCRGTFVNGTSYMSCLAAASFDAAEAACQDNGMHLVKIDSAEENAVVLSVARDDYVWIGGSNRSDPNEYTWLDGTAFFSSDSAVPGTYVNFGNAEPAQDAALRCVQLRQTGNGTWSNWQCSGMQSFVCEAYVF